MNIKQQLCYSGSVFAGLYLVWYLFYGYLYYFNQICAISILSVISWTIGFYLYDKYNVETIVPHNKAVLVTGCDTGFGHNLVQRLDKFGFHVHAGVLFPGGEGAKELKRKCSKRLTIHKMDVTSQEDVQNVVAAIKNRSEPLWAVVNNAGIAFGVPLDWGNDVDVLKRTFEVNVFGVTRVTKYCLPLIRQSGGRIVNVASLAGRISAANISHYCMAKHSVRVLSNTIRQENMHHNFKVVTIEPTFYKTPIIDAEQLARNRARIYEETPEDIKLDYDDSILKRFDNTEQSLKLISRPNVDEVTDAMMKAVTLQEPKLFYRCCGYHDIVVWIIGVMPECLTDYVTVLLHHPRFISLAKTVLTMVKPAKKS